MIWTIHGKAHRRTIELEEDLGVAEGQEIEVQIRVIQNSPRKPGDGFIRTEGALANDNEWDTIMDEIYRARKVERQAQVPDLCEP